MLAQSLLGQAVKLIESTPFKADTFIGVDGYKNLYFVKTNVFHKQGAEGSFMFNDYQLGQISSVDIINPLKIVLFYEDVNTVVLVDNKLSEIERINFNNVPDLINVSTATNAGNNKLWIFNVDTNQLELYDYRSQRRTTVSQPFVGKLLSQASNFNYCFMLTERKLRTFNVYGSLLSELAAEGFEKIVQQNENVLALKRNELFYISENSIKPIKIPISENTIKDLQLTQDLLYIYDGINILIYKLTQPKQ
jgi:hypothetical protein